MARTAKHLGRLARLFRDLETVERAKVAELSREIEGLRNRQDDILRSLESPSPLHHPFVGLLSSRVGSLERRLQRLAAERETALDRFTKAAARRRSASEILADAVDEEARRSEKRELEALLEFSEATAAQGRGKSPRSTS